MKLAVNIIGLLLLSSLSACSQQTLDQRLENLYRHSVPLIKPAELREWQEAGQELLLLDTRSCREFEVSHLAGASFVDYENFKPQDLQHLSKEQKVVVYCSVGYRSERIGERLKEMGFEEVYNLYGGIFEWKNQGNQVVDSQEQPTEKVHVFNRQWGKWLKEGIKVYE